MPVRPKLDPKLWKRFRIFGFVFCTLAAAELVLATVTLFEARDSKHAYTPFLYFGMAALWAAMGIYYLVTARKMKRTLEQSQPVEVEE